MLAPKSHLIVLLLAIVGVSFWNSMHSPLAKWAALFTSSHDRIVAYLNMPLLPLIWIVFIWIGMRKTSPMRSLLDANRLTGSRWLRLIGLGIAGLIVWIALSAALSMVLRPTPEQLRGLQAMLPHTAFERTVWLLCAPLAGILEELVYRGYVMQQFKAWSGSGIVAVVFQAIAYALAHLMLPPAMLIPIALLGVYLALLAVWQKSLIPPMIVHAGVGVFAFAATG